MGNQPGVPPEPAQLADRAAITDLLHCHSRGLDRLDADLLRAVYWPDATVAYGTFNGPAMDFIPGVIGALGQYYQLTRHSIANVLIIMDGEEARSESHCIASHLSLGGTQEMLFFSRYLDIFMRRDGAWRISHRKVVMDWCRRHQFEDERSSAAYGDMARGYNNTEDPLHAFWTAQ